MFNNYDTKDNCYKFLRSFVFLTTDDGKVFYNKGTYHLACGEFAPCDYVVKYRKKVDGQKKYGVYLRSFYFGGSNLSCNAFRFLNENDITNLLIRNEDSNKEFKDA